MYSYGLYPDGEWWRCPWMCPTILCLYFCVCQLAAHTIFCQGINRLLLTLFKNVIFKTFLSIQFYLHQLCILSFYFTLLGSTSIHPVIRVCLWSIVSVRACLSVLISCPGRIINHMICLLFYAELLNLPTRRYVGDTWSLAGCGIPAASPGWRGSAPGH